MARYFCHFTIKGVIHSDVHGFDAADDVEAIEILRTMAKILSHGDATAGDAGAALYDDAGRLVTSSTIAALVSTLQ